MDYKLKKYWLLKLAVVLVVLALGWFGGWWDNLSGKVSPSRKSASSVSVPGINLFNTKLIGWNRHQKAWEIQARHIWQSPDGNVIYFRSISQGIIFSIANHTAKFHAGWARYEKLKGVLYIGKGLEVTVENHIFQTPDVVMRYSNHEIRCEHGIAVTGPDITIRARKMRLNLAEEEVWLEGNVLLKQNEDQVTTGALRYNLKEKQYELLEPGGISLQL